MTAKAAHLPAVDSQWEGPDGSIATVTKVTVIHGKPNVCYDTVWPGTDRWAVGVSDAAHFTATRTPLTAAADRG